MKNLNNIKKSKFFIFLLFFLGCVFSLVVLSTNHKTVAEFDSIKRSNENAVGSYVFSYSFKLRSDEGIKRPLLAFNKHSFDFSEYNGLSFVKPSEYTRKLDFYDFEKSDFKNLKTKALASTNLEKFDYIMYGSKEHFSKVRHSLFAKHLDSVSKIAKQEQDDFQERYNKADEKEKFELKNYAFSDNWKHYIDVAEYFKKYDK